MTPKKITNWSVRSPAYAAPELGKKYLAGTYAGSPIETSRIMRKAGPLTYETRSGTHYELVGPPDPGFVAYCESIGKPLDLADPIKFV